MVLHKIKDFDPDYKAYFDGKDIFGYDLYSGNDKIGSVDDLLVDDQGRFRYFVIHTGAWIFGKRVLLPVGRTRIMNNDRRLNVDLTRQQVENLPAYDDLVPVDYEHEENVRGIYRPTATTTDATAATTAPGTYDRNTYAYEQEPALYGLNERDHNDLRLYEERLIANKTRQKSGEVTVGKRVETEQSRIEVPLERERVVIERVPTDATATSVAPGEASFAEGEVTRMEVYEEVPDIHKEAYVREQVRVRKEVEQTSATVEDEIRRERLDVRTDGKPNVER